MRISVRHIQETVAADFGISHEAMIGHSKRRKNALPRLIAFKLSRELTPLSWPVLAKLFERDHTTLIYGARAADRYLAKDRTLALKVEARTLLLKSEMQKVAPVADYVFPSPTYDHLPWCPLEYQADYRNLRKKGFTAAEARPMIEDMIRATLARTAPLRVEFRCGLESRWTNTAKQMRWTDTGDSFDIVAVARV